MKTTGKSGIGLSRALFDGHGSPVRVSFVLHGILTEGASHETSKTHVGQLWRVAGAEVLPATGHRRSTAFRGSLCSSHIDIP